MRTVASRSHINKVGCYECITSAIFILNLSEMIAKHFNFDR